MQEGVEEKCKTPLAEKCNIIIQDNNTTRNNTLSSNEESILTDTEQEKKSDLKNSSLKNICVITNDLYIALELYQKKDIKVLLLGGEVSSETGSTATVFSLQQIEGYNADIAFLGVSSISEFFDLTVPTEIKAFLKRTMMKISKETVLLVDSSKFQKKKLYKFANIKNFDYVVTDYTFSKEEIKKYHLKKKIITIK